MFTQFYFGGISPTLLCFLPKELKDCFKNNFCIFLYQSIALYFLPSFLYVFLFSLTCLDTAQSLFVAAWKRPLWSEQRGETMPFNFLNNRLHCKQLWNCIESAWKQPGKCNWYRNFNQPSQSHRLQLKAELLLSDHTCI
jgi:hypothetical protein